MKTMKIWRKSRLSESHANMFANGRTGAIYVIALAMLAVLSLSSCDKQDGDWDSMVWKAEVPMVIDDGVYDVSDRGGTFTFTCRNYSKPWIEGAVSGEEHYFPDREKNDYHTIMADWNSWRYFPHLHVQAIRTSKIKRIANNENKETLEKIAIK